MTSDAVSKPPGATCSIAGGRERPSGSASVIPWEMFCPKLPAALTAQNLRTPPTERRSAAGRKPWGEVVIFKALVAQALYNLSGEQWNIGCVTGCPSCGF